MDKGVVTCHKLHEFSQIIGGNSGDYTTTHKDRETACLGGI